MDGFVVSTVELVGAVAEAVITGEVAGVESVVGGVAATACETGGVEGGSSATGGLEDWMSAAFASAFETLFRSRGSTTRCELNSSRLSLSETALYRDLVFPDDATLFAGVLVRGFNEVVPAGACGCSQSSLDCSEANPRIDFDFEDRFHHPWQPINEAPIKARQIKVTSFEIPRSLTRFIYGPQGVEMTELVEVGRFEQIAAPGGGVCAVGLRISCARAI